MKTFYFYLPVERQNGLRTCMPHSPRNGAINTVLRCVNNTKRLKMLVTYLDANDLTQNDLSRSFFTVAPIVMMV